jgi:hypothetical protein
MKLQLTSAVLFSVWLLAAPWSVRAQEPMASNPKPTSSLSPVSIDTATTPKDHLRLADYFRDLAAQEQALAKSYDRIAKIYKDRTLPPGLDPASAREMKNQYRHLAETGKKAAEAAATIAAYHVRLADLVERLPVAPGKQANPQDSAFRR